MSTREMLHNMIDQMSDAQMQAWLLILGVRSDVDDTASRIAIFNRLEEMIRPVPQLDYDNELQAWREEKFGV